MSSERIIVGLDIGTTEIRTVIGEVPGDGVLDIIGEGSVPSDGLRKGVVVNLERTIESVRQSIAAAERVAGVQVESAWLAVAGSHVQAFSSHGMAAIRRGQEVTKADLDRTIENARAIPMESHMEVLHVLPQEYVVDGNDGIKDPIGMSGVRLEVDVHVVAASEGPLANLRRCAEDAGIQVDGLVVQSLASGLAVLNEAERDLTTVLIDVGGGTTDVGVFKRGVLAHSAVIPLGGDHVTQDISQLLRIPPDEADRVKIGHGVALPDMADREVVLEVSNPGYKATISAFELAQVIKPRLMEIFDLAKQSIETHLGAVELGVSNVVLTGGASTMPGVDRLAADRFRLPIRIGAPHGVSGLTDVVSKPSHATSVGLVRYGMLQGEGGGAKPNDRGGRSAAPEALQRIRNLFKDFF